MAKKEYDVNRTWLKFILAALLFNVLIITAFVTSTPEQSPASTWITWVYQLRFKLSPITAQDMPKLAALHLDASKLPKPECVACHGTMLDSKVALHKLHLTSQLLPGLACHDCHRSIDLAPRGNTVVVKWVDVAFCKKCHSEFPGLKPGSPMRPENFKEDCTTCHSGNHAFRHEQPYLSQIIAPRECPTCHGATVLPWNPLHEQPDWLQNHGPEALRTGTQTCFKCHDFGFKFCDACHAIKPPSHLPADAWLATNHQDAARADTRACYTCHKIAFCNKCHQVKHPANWRTAHPAFVKANGTATCVRCHSLSFCSYCHAQPSAPGTGSGSTP